MAQPPLTPNAANASAVWAICEELRVQMLDAQLNALFGAELWAVLALNVGVMALCCWALCRHTPPEMAAYRWHLANVAVCSFLADALSLIIFPSAYQTDYRTDVLVLHAIGPVGVLGGDVIKSGLFVFLDSIVALFVAVLYAIAYRFAAITDCTELFKKKGTIALMASWEVLCGVPVALCYATSFAPKDSQVMELEVCFAAHQNVVVLSFEGYAVFGILVYTLSLVLLPSLVLAVKTLLALKRKRALISLDTYQYQKQLTTALILQISVPTTIYCIPLLLGIFAINGDQTIAAIARIVANSCAHTALNGLIMLATIRPYREALRQKWTDLRRKMRGAVVEPQNAHN